MPTYEYRCPHGHDFEKFFRSMSAAEAATSIVCPKCGSIALRQLSSAGLMFKGSGFYLTDYGKNAHGKKGPPAKAGAEGGSSGGGDGGSSGGAGDSGASGSGDSGSSSSKSADSGGSDSGSSGSKSGSSSGGDAKGSGASSSTGGDSPGSGSKKSDKPAQKASPPSKPSSGNKNE